ncbi:hypothetical protein GF357_01705 [Candidatus Dojkabacteria bacterium]|nr:hypothetical protein [Candidatus Dojkabacteria bacterium]
MVSSCFITKYYTIFPMIKSKTEYENKKFSNYTLDNRKILSSIFINCKFTDSSLVDTTFEKCTFENCIFKDCNLTVIKFPETSLVECEFFSSKLSGIDWSQARSELGLEVLAKNCDLSYSTFFLNDISNSKFIECKFHETTFEKVKMLSASFGKCDFTKARFQNCTMDKADLSSSYNFYFDPSQNSCKKLKMSRSEALNLLNAFGIEYSN